MPDSSGESPKKDCGESENSCSSEIIHVKVVSKTRGKLVFKMFMNTEMKRLKKAYCQRKGIESGHFLLPDGLRVLDDHTPKTLEMKDGDVIEMYDA